MAGVFTVLVLAMLKQGGRIMEYKERVAAYRLAMSIAKTMLQRGIISDKEYGVIDRLMAEKYGISLSSIFR